MVLRKSISLQPIDGIKDLSIQFYQNKGWLINFSVVSSDGAGTIDCYIVTNSFTIYGGFTFLKLFPKFTNSDFLFQEEKEEYVIDWISGKAIDWYEQKIKESTCEIPKTAKERKDLFINPKLELAWNNGGFSKERGYLYNLSRTQEPTNEESNEIHKPHCLEMLEYILPLWKEICPVVSHYYYDTNDDLFKDVHTFRCATWTDKQFAHRIN